MTHSNLHDDPTAPAMPDASSPPAHDWSPDRERNIKVHWESTSTGGFDVVLQLINPEPQEDAGHNLILRIRVEHDDPQVPFSVYAKDNTLVMSGQFEYRQPKCPPQQVGGLPPTTDQPPFPAAELWLCNAIYPGGSIEAVKIA